LAILLTTTVLGQNRDTRAELEITGRINEISVAPNEKIWFTTAIGNTYFTNSIDSNWHYGYGKPLLKAEDDYGFDHPYFDRVSFFNNDTAIITGYISHSEKGLEKNGYYRTTDAGESWELLNYGGNSWIYTVFVDETGNVWMGELPKQLYYSNDFGVYDIEFSKFINACIPDNFMGKGVFDNSRLIMEIADYLWYRED
jgi:hypothetical protein